MWRNFFRENLALRAIRQLSVFVISSCDSIRENTDRDAIDREATDREAPDTEGGGEYGTDEYGTKKDGNDGVLTFYEDVEMHENLTERDEHVFGDTESQHDHRRIAILQRYGFGHQGLPAEGGVKREQAYMVSYPRRSELLNHLHKGGSRRDRSASLRFARHRPRHTRSGSRKSTH
ncbi:hypothetical protein DY000_02037742 [Brassica cretica]|uniref:Uncharacterized protein n=1 Tax=Brassica cretica TaxID=69181 RepID=A0ABQ7B7Q9_BRACR|nr:hypothetical protein DY000_02037742 [Brassica cretica]